MTDRRRINGPPSGTVEPFFVDSHLSTELPQRIRRPNELRKIFLKTGLVPAASGSAYLELETTQRSAKHISQNVATLKLTCSVHGPKPVPRTSSFSPNLQLTTSVKFAPFATQLRRGYLRDSSERDLGVHLETALRGAIIPGRWPKSAIEVVVTVLEAEDTPAGRTSTRGIEDVGIMNILAGCITVASAALVDARVDCLDLLAGGVAAVVSVPDFDRLIALDPNPSEHDEVISACVLGYLTGRDEITDIWARGDLTMGRSLSVDGEDLIDSAINAARGSQLILEEAVKESAYRWNDQTKGTEAQRSVKNDNEINDVEMKT